MTNVAQDTQDQPVQAAGYYPRVNLECVEDYRASFAATSTDARPDRMLRIHLDIPFDASEDRNWGDLTSALRSGNKEKAREVALDVARRIIATDRRRATAVIEAALAD